MLNGRVLSACKPDWRSGSFTVNCFLGNLRSGLWQWQSPPQCWCFLGGLVRSALMGHPQGMNQNSLDIICPSGPSQETGQIHSQVLSSPSLRLHPGFPAASMSRTLFCRGPWLTLPAHFSTVPGEEMPAGPLKEVNNEAGWGEHLSSCPDFTS